MFKNQPWGLKKVVVMQRGALKISSKLDSGESLLIQAGHC